MEVEADAHPAQRGRACVFAEGRDAGHDGGVVEGAGTRSAHGCVGRAVVFVSSRVLYLERDGETAAG